MTHDTNTTRTDEERPDTRVGTPRPTYAGERRWRDSCFIYVIEDRAQKAVKIGIANDPDRRLGCLQVGNPRPLHIVHCFEASSYDRAKQVEGIVHKSLRNRHILGEWFDICADGASDAIKSVAKLHAFTGALTPTVSPGYPEPAAGLIPLVSPLVKNGEGR